MSTVIFQNKQRMIPREHKEGQRIFERLHTFLPQRVLSDIQKYIFDERLDGLRLEEIRLRSNRHTYITVGGRWGKQNLKLDVVLGQSEMLTTFERMCEGSLYTYGESIVNGYASIGCGIRVGICGRATVEKGRVVGVYNINGLNVRIPRSSVAVSDELYLAIRASISKGEGVLIFSPPAQGKTTLLRSLCPKLAGGEKAMRVVVIDSREEIGTFENNSDLSLDVFSGYPKAEAIMIATAYMNPEVIICDEIGSADEAKSIAMAQNCGVPLVATAHADSVHSLLRRAAMYELHSVHAFGLYVGIKIGTDGVFEYTLCDREEAERLLACDRYNNSADKWSGR